MRGREVFVDAGAWIAIAIAPDAHHAAATQTYQMLLRQSRRLVTTNLVVAEAYISILRVGGHAAAIRFLRSLRQSSRLLKLYSDAGLEEQAERILVQHADQDFSFADAVSFAVMRQRSMPEAFAFDRHFQTAGFVTVPAAS